MSYNLNLGCMDDVLVTDKYTAESVTHFPITPNAIYITDAGYSKGVNLAHIVSCYGDALFRASPNHLSLAADNKGTEKIDMVKKLDTKANLIDFACMFTPEKMNMSQSALSQAVYLKIKHC